MTNKERLEQIKDAIARELGLTDDYMDGTYLYHLTRSKSAFAVGTMTIDDFKEIDEELLDDIFNAIKPFFIQQAERVQELENVLLELVKQNKELRKSIAFYSSESYNAHLEKLLDRSEKQLKRYREALEFYANRDNYKLEHFDPNIDDYMNTVDYDEGQTARKALEDEE